MRGNLLIVKDFQGRLLIRRCWESTTNKVYVTDEGGFKRLIAGDHSIVAIGFPMGDVFEYDESAASAIRDGRDYDPAKLVPLRKTV